jgi:FdhE protein
VAGGFIRKLWHRAAPVSPQVEEAVGELARLAQERPALAGPTHLLRDLLPRLYETAVSELAPSLDGERAAVKLASGVPLLRHERLAVDADAFRRRWLHVCGALEQHQGDETARHLAECMRHGPWQPQELVDETLAGRPEAIHARAEALGLDAGLAATVLRLTLFPVFSQINASVTPLYQGTRWSHGYCPTCGSWPLLGEFRGLEQTRFLRCGLCAADWEFARLACPFCGTRDHRQLGYFHVEGEEARQRAATCNACRGYVKMRATLTPLKPLELLVADAATLHLDLAAAERGYTATPAADGGG